MKEDSEETSDDHASDAGESSENMAGGSEKAKHHSEETSRGLADAAEDLEELNEGLEDVLVGEGSAPEVSKAVMILEHLALKRKEPMT